VKKDMDARKFLRVSDLSLLNAYEATGHVVYVRRKKDGRILVSLDGMSGVDMQTAREKILAIGDPRPRVQNPVPNTNSRDVKKAAKLYKEFREETPKRGRVVEFELPKAVMIMGNIRAISYDTTRRGKTELYKHDFAPGSRPLLCADGKSGQLFIIEGRYHVTPRGIVDLDAAGREIDD
jgi:hypothetical protein